MESGLQDAAYAELIGVVTTVLSLDDVHRGIGLPLEPLPDPIPGEPERRRPSGARALALGLTWCPPRRSIAKTADIYQGIPDPPNILRAMSLAPNEVRILLDIHEAHYLSLEQMMSGKFDRVLRPPADGDHRRPGLSTERVLLLNNRALNDAPCERRSDR